jgi:IS5 family transposase
MGGQIVDATIVAAPKQRNTDAEKADIKVGKLPDAWKEKPAKLRQKDRDARWTVKFSKAKVPEDGKSQQRDIAIPAFGYKSHVNVDRRCRLIRRFAVTDAARHDGAQLPALLNPDAFDSRVWADSAYRSAANEAAIAAAGRRSMVHFRKPRGRPMSGPHRRANRARSAVRSAIEHVFAEQKARMGLFVRTIGLARATVKIGLANIAYNLRRLAWLNGRSAPA